MTRDSTCDVPSGARRVSSGAGGGWAPEGTRTTKAEEKFCCRAVRRKHKMAAESKEVLTPSSHLLPHLNPAVAGEDKEIITGVITGLGGGFHLRIQGISSSFTARGAWAHT